MTSITIHDLDDTLTRRLGRCAAEHGRSVEEEARDILHQVITGSTAADADMKAAQDPAAAPENLGRTIHARFAAIGGVDLEAPGRGQCANRRHFPEGCGSHA
ncbi:plasmid stabilization protein [Tistrella mobilis]|uniref:FitA-like ribbon-helix-helix domain-containing protein n=1 Tax=Tistrella mobilis TaxID=171437 RepID=UPI003558FC86